MGISAAWSTREEAKPPWCWDMGAYPCLRQHLFLLGGIDGCRVRPWASPDPPHTFPSPLLAQLALCPVS